MTPISRDFNCDTHVHYSKPRPSVKPGFRRLFLASASPFRAKPIATSKSFTELLRYKVGLPFGDSGVRTLKTAPPSSISSGRKTFTWIHILPCGIVEYTNLRLGIRTCHIRLGRQQRGQHRPPMTSRNRELRANSVIMNHSRYLIPNPETDQPVPHRV